MKEVPTMSHGVKVGDVFVESWGYDQTNVDFYQVTRAMPKSVEIRAIHGKTVGDGHSTRVVADVDNFIEDKGYGAVRYGTAKVKRVSTFTFNGKETVSLHMTSYSNAYLEVPESSHFDTLAAGYAGR